MSNAQIIAGGRAIENRTDPGAIGTIVGANDGTVTKLGSAVLINIPENTPEYSLARADALQRARVSALVIGIIGGDTSEGAQLRLQFQGIVELPTEVWDAITGGSGGLVAGATSEYYLSDTTAGALTQTPNATSTHFVTLVGWAISPTQLQLAFGTPVKNP